MLVGEWSDGDILVELEQDDYSFMVIGSMVGKADMTLHLKPEKAAALRNRITTALAKRNGRVIVPS